MRFAPYLAEVSFAFDKVQYPYTEMALYWSNTGLEALPPAHLQYIPPGLNTPLPVSLQKTSPVVKFLNLPDNQAVKATLTATFSNGDVLENAFVDILFSAFLARFAIRHIAYQDEATGKQILAAQLSWQIDPLLINRVDHYTLQSPMVCGNQALQVRYEAAYIIHSLLPGEIVPVTLSAIGFDGAALGALSLNLYVPALKLIPTRANVSGIGYGKQMDRNGIQEIYQVNHNQTIAQMTLPTQQHATETRSLGAPLALMDPATVVSGTAREYVNAFDPNDHNQAFDYSAAKAAGTKIASESTASFNQQHQGNYTFNHEGTLNQATTAESYSELTEASQINNTIENYNGTYSGETFSKTVNDYYEQVDTETLNINEHHLEAPVYEENTGQLQEQINHYNVNAQSIHFEGDHFTHNGTLFLEGKFDLGWNGGYQPKPFVQPKRTPQSSYTTIPVASDDYYIFLATVYGESASVPAAWEAEADSIVLRAAQNSQTPGQAVAAPRQYDAYINPKAINFDNVDFGNPLMRDHIQFLKAYAYLTHKTLNKNPAMTLQESKTLVSMDIQIRPIYALYSNKNVLLKPLVAPSWPDQNDTCAQEHKQNNPANPLKYYITNYYSPQGQGDAPVAFLGNIPRNINPNEYEVIVPDVTQRQFRFYNIPHKYH